VESEKAFNEAIVNFDYDQAVVHYMLTAKRKTELIVGISKKRPERLFKKIIKQHDESYLIGEQKLIDSLDLLYPYSPDDIKLVA